MVSAINRRVLFIARCLFFILSLQLVAQYAATAAYSAMPEADYNALFKEGVAAFEKGAFDEAKSIFNRLFHMNPSDPGVNFYLGRSAFETGDFEGAVFAFERILIEVPDRQRVRLEMARAYMEMGSLEEASRLFHTVLDTQPPDGVRATILAFLARIKQMRKAHFFSGSISVGLNFDSNVYVAPTEDLITIPALDDLPVSLEDSESDILFPVILLVTHTYKPPDASFYWTSSIQSFNTWYNEYDDLDINYLSVSTGVGYRTGNWDVGLLPQGYIMSLSGDRYSDAWGGSLSASVSLGKGSQVGASAQVLEKRFFQTDGRDGSSVILEGYVRFPIGKVGVSPFLSYKNESADLAEYSYDRLGAGISFSMPMFFGTNLFGGYLFERDEYDGRNVLFETTRQDDTHIVSLGISRAFRIGNRSQCVVRIAQTREYSNSNIPLYDYDRDVTRLSISFGF